MRKLFLLLGVILTASLPEAQPAAAAGRFAGPLPSTFVSGGSRHDAVVVLVAGKGGGMGGGAVTGGMGDGTFGGGMFNSPTADFGATNSSGWPGNSAQPSYYTYQCVTASGQCSFVAPASLRASSLRAGARCSCSDGLSQGQVK